MLIQVKLLERLRVVALWLELWISTLVTGLKLFCGLINDAVTTLALIVSLACDSIASVCIIYLLLIIKSCAVAISLIQNHI